jgi:putative ABC transport system ATP-binding protein
MLLPKTPEDEIDNLSGGERQRLYLARALFLRPKLMLLDEPASALDSETAKMVLDNFIEAVNDSGINVIMVSHSLQTITKQAEMLTVRDKSAVWGVRG